MKKFLAMLMAGVMLCGVLTGCGGGKKTSQQMEDPNTVPEDPYEIQWYLMVDAQNDVASVEEALNAYLKDKINATVKMNCLPSSQYTQKVGTMINACLLYTSAVRIIKRLSGRFTDNFSASSRPFIFGI